MLETWLGMSPGVLRPLGLAWRPALHPASSMPSKGKPRDLSRIRIGRDGEHHGDGNREVASHCNRTLICDPSSSSKSVTRRTMERSLARAVSQGPPQGPTRQGKV
jgi:hypothetical protein